MVDQIHQRCRPLASASPVLEPGSFEMALATQRWDWSPSMYGLLGVPPSTQPTISVVVGAKHPNDRALTRQMIAGAVGHRQSFRYQSRVVRPDGRIRTVEATGLVALAADGSPTALVGTVSSVTDWADPDFELPRREVVDEGDLAVALWARLEEAHAYAVRRYASAVVRSARLVLRSGADLDDVVQSVFEGLWRHPERFDPTRGSLVTLLRMQARARAIDLIRSEVARTDRARRYRVATGLDEPDSVQEDSPTISIGELRRGLDLLPRAERESVELAYFGGMTYRSVAAHLGLPEGTVKSRIRAALSHLRQHLHGADILTSRPERPADPVELGPAGTRESPLATVSHESLVERP